MPTLKDLKCSIELSESQRALQEFGTTYGDGCVETFVPVPSKPQAFSIHLTSDKFIAPGISMYVFVDGVYQCNRNRQDLKLRKSSDSRSVVDFRVRQKEEKQKDGSMIAREWKFEKLNTTSADEAPDACSPNFLDNIGCIEVLILRCAGPRNAKTISAMSLDGSGDIPPPPFGFDGQPRTPNIRSVYDDRVPFFGGGSNNHGPPPPISSYRSPYAETVRSHETLHRGHRNSHILNNNKISPFAGSGQHRTHSRFSEPISPGARPPPSIPSEAFQYGSGPIPPGPMMGSERSFYHNRPTTAVAANAPGVDPAWLSEMLTTAVKRGVEEARRVEPAASETQKQHVMNVETSSQPPGAWPQSPYAPDAPQTVQFPNAGGGYHDTQEYGGATWGSPEGEWSNSQAKEKSKAHVSWDTESKWESQTNAGGWNGVEEMASDTWDSDKTLEARKPDIRRASKWNTSRAPTIRSRFDERASSPLTTRTRQSHRSSEGHRSRRTRSKSHTRSSRRDEKYSSSSKDCDGWNRVEASSGSLASSELTDEREQRPRSRSHTHNSRNQSQSRRRSHRTQSAHGEERRPSRYDRGGGSETTSKRRNAMSMASGISPSVMQVPLPTQQPVYQPQFQARSVNYAEPTATIPKTHPGWVPAPSETYHKPSFATSNALPGPFSVNGEALGHRGSSKSWDNSKEERWGKEKTAKSMNSQYDGIPAARDSWGSGNDHQQPGWDAEGDNGWEGKTTGDDLKNGWQVTEKGNKPKGAWGVTEEQQTGWATDENGWEAKDLENADKKVPGGWDAGFNGTSAQYPPWATTTSSPKDVQWSTKPSPTNKKLPKPSPPSKRHTSKSLSKYRTPSSTHPKPHWQFPPPPSSDQLPSTTSTLPPLPLPKISSARASAKGVEHQVQLGSGSQYGHVVGRPEYLDSLEKPYAVFRFKYRSRGVLGKMFGEEEVREHGRTKATEAREREKLGALGREELIGEMVRLKMGGGKASRATESVARDLTENWVKRHSWDPSERGEEKGWRDPNRWS